MRALPEPVPGPEAADPGGPRPGHRHGHHRTGLRERKKAKTRAAIRHHALRLFREQGYGATTVDQIAEAADISPSTFFRYFPTKEDVVLQDELDIMAAGAFESQPAGLSPVAAFRAATREALGALGEDEMARLRETAELTLTVPELRARAMDELARTMTVIAQAAAKRSGRDPDDFAARNQAGAIVGVIGVHGITMPQGAAVVAIYVLLALVALLIDRRALLVSGLFYVLYTVTELFRAAGTMADSFAVTALIIGGSAPAPSLSLHGARTRVGGRSPPSTRATAPAS